MSFSGEIKEVLKRLGLSTESLDQIRLGRGVVGKTSYVALAGMGVLGIVAWQIKQDWLPIVVGAVLLIFLVYFIGILKFASRNPATALLEGAELLRWRQYDLAAKDLPNPPSLPPIAGPKKLPMLPPTTEEPHE